SCSRPRPWRRSGWRRPAATAGPRRRCGSLRWCWRGCCGRGIDLDCIDCNAIIAYISGIAHLTVRPLAERLKPLLRVRAAGNKRSMEDEIRVILRQAAEETSAGALDRAEPPHAPAAQPAATTAPAPDTRRVVLIIGGGIAAYKALDLIRRLRERRCAVRCILTAAAQQFVTPLAASALAGAPALTDLFDPRRGLSVGHTRLPRGC